MMRSLARQVFFFFFDCQDNAGKCTTSSLCHSPCVGQSSHVSHPCLVRLSLVQRLATAYPSLMFALNLSTPSFCFSLVLILTDLAFACSCFVPSFVITHTLVSGYLFVQLCSQMPLTNGRSCTLVIPTCYHLLRFSTLSLDLNTCCLSSSRPFLRHQAHTDTSWYRKITCNHFEVGNKWCRINDARIGKRKEKEQLMEWCWKWIPFLLILR